MKQLISLLLLVVSFALLAAMPPPSAAQGISEPLPTAVVTPEVLETKIAEVEAATGLEEQAKTKLVELYRRALSYLQSAASHAEAVEAFR